MGICVILLPDSSFIRDLYSLDNSVAFIISNILEGSLEKTITVTIRTLNFQTSSHFTPLLCLVIDFIDYLCVKRIAEKKGLFISPIDDQ